MLLQILLLVVTCAWTVSSASLNSNTLDDLYPNINDLGPYENLVSATIEILPGIADIFEKISGNRKLAEDPLSPDSLLELMLAFMPITRRVLLSHAKVEGRKVTQEELDRLDEVQEALPSAFDYIRRLKRVNFNTSTPDFNEINRLSSSPKDSVIVGSNVVETKVLPPRRSSGSSSLSSPSFFSVSSLPSPSFPLSSPFSFGSSSSPSTLFSPFSFLSSSSPSSSPLSSPSFSSTSSFSPSSSPFVSSISSSPPTSSPSSSSVSLFPSTSSLSFSSNPSLSSSSISSFSSNPPSSSSSISSSSVSTSPSPSFRAIHGSSVTDSKSFPSTSEENSVLSLPSPNSRSIRRPSSIYNNYHSLSDAKVLYGSQAIKTGSFLSSPPQFRSLPSARVLRGVSAVEEPGSLFDGDTSTSFIQMPHSGAIFIRHPPSRY